MKTKSREQKNTLIQSSQNFLRNTFEKLFLLFFIFSSSLWIFSCANQQPPSGGEDDKTPPRVKKITPKPNTIRFKGKSIYLEFDKYVDRRSFRESFYISPKPSVEPEFDWGSKDVEIKFQEPLLKNKTYSFLVTKGFKDYLGNFITEPIQFAISTGDSIDNGSISGKVFSKNFNNIIIFAYSLNGKIDTMINPLRISPDYLTQVNENGSYTFNHISKANYRVFALKDVNKNMVYDKGVDEISVLPDDIIMDTTEDIRKVNFLFIDIIPDEKYVYSPDFLKAFRSLDTANYIFVSLKNNEKDVPIEPRIFLYFKNSKLSKYDIADNIKMFDSTDNKNCRIVLNWTADTLLEIFPVEKLNYTAAHTLTVDLSKTDKKSTFQIRFITADEKKFGKITGSVFNKYLIPHSVYVKLVAKNNNVYIKSRTIDNDSSFAFLNLPEGEYSLFAYIDENGNGAFDSGNPYPYTRSEKFFIFEQALNLKGNWSIDNVTVRF